MTTFNGPPTGFQFTTKKLRARWSAESAQDMYATYGDPALAAKLLNKKLLDEILSLDTIVNIESGGLDK